jgi:hypothetical protein
MGSSVSLQYQRETAPDTNTGGCFSLLLFPPVTIIMIIFVFFMVTTGETKVVRENELEKQAKTTQGSGEIAPLFTPEVQRWIPTLSPP